MVQKWLGRRGRAENQYGRGRAGAEKMRVFCPMISAAKNFTFRKLPILEFGRPGLEKHTGAMLNIDARLLVERRNGAATRLSRQSRAPRQCSIQAFQHRSPERELGQLERWPMHPVPA
jgi:hypothetical protein